MRITTEAVILDGSQMIPWDQVNMLRVANTTLQFILHDGRVVAVPGCARKNIDRAFYAFTNTMRARKSS